MANTVPEYVIPLIQKQNDAAGLLGVQILLIDGQAYRMNLTVLMLLGVVMKALNDKGLVSDAEWIAALSTATAGDWPAWLLNQIPPS